MMVVTMWKRLAWKEFRLAVTGVADRVVGSRGRQRKKAKRESWQPNEKSNERTSGECRIVPCNLAI